MAKMIMIWKRLEDARAFDEHYFGVHVPLAKKLPGLRKYEVSTGPIVTRVGPSAETYLIATLHFDNLSAITRRRRAKPARETTAHGPQRR